MLSELTGRMSRFSKFDIWIYLDDNFETYISLSKKRKNSKLITPCDDILALLEKYKDKILDMMSTIAKKQNRYVWWSGELASKSCTSTNLIRNIIYYIFAVDCIDHYVRSKHKSVLIICADAGVKKSIAKYLNKEPGLGYYQIRKILSFKSRFTSTVLQPLWDLLRSFRDNFLLHKAARILDRPNLSHGKNVIIRSWFSNFPNTDNQDFVDRNFGTIHRFFEKKGYIVYFLPMFISMDSTFTRKLLSLKNKGIKILLSQSFADWIAFLRLQMLNVRRYFIRFRDIGIEKYKVEYILRFENKTNAFRRGLNVYNLDYYLLEKLRKQEAKLTHVLYAFENNAPEKLFLLGLKRFFPETEVRGFQHTILLHNNFSTMLSREEENIHPLPNRIVCSGKEFKKNLFREKFPDYLLEDGPNLRFEKEAGYTFIPRTKSSSAGPMRVFIPLPYSFNLSVELLFRYFTAIKGESSAPDTLIKPHPFIDKVKLIKFLKYFGFNDYEFVDGQVHNYFSSCSVTMNIGASVTMLEALIIGIPLVRIIPKFTFFFDPLHSFSYPVNPVSSKEELRNSLLQAREIENSKLKAISDRVKKEYFNPVNVKYQEAFL